MRPCHTNESRRLVLPGTSCYFIVLYILFFCFRLLCILRFISPAILNYRYSHSIYNVPIGSLLVPFLISSASPFVFSVMIYSSTLKITSRFLRRVRTYPLKYEASDPWRKKSFNGASLYWFYRLNAKMLHVNCLFAHSLPVYIIQLRSYCMS
jgi:hypothetical protein